MIKEPMVELAEKTKITNVLYADAPLKSGGTPKEITLDELNQKISRSFIYSDALVSKKKHPPYAKKGATFKSQAANFLVKKFEEIGFADISSLVICNMGKLGHGVFANKDFEPHECFILYAGVIANKVSLEKNKSDYSFSYSKDIVLLIDAEERGNISRFVQHMPLNFDLFKEHVSHQPGYKKSDLQNIRESSDCWQWRNLDYKAGLTESDVAWANLSMMVIFLQEVPCIVFYNTRKITQGEQLGISYGHDYWARRKIKPALFDLSGDIIPESFYGYKEVVVDLPLIGLFNQFDRLQEIAAVKSYNRTMFEKDLQRNDPLQPVWFSHLSEPVSIFKLRESLLYYNVIGETYKPVENDFVLSLRSVLPSEFKVSIFQRNPYQQSQRPIYDVVCMTEDLMKWSQLTVLLKNPQFAAAFPIKNKCLKLTQEVIIMEPQLGIRKHLRG